MQKSPVSDSVIPTLLVVDGLICVFMAVFAYKIGVDPNIAWGRARYFLILLGTLLIFSSLILNYFKRKNSFLESVIKSENVKTIFLVGHLWILIFVIYAWFITFGNFTAWNHSTQYYTQLADAFGKGQLYVDRSPGQAMLEAQDPYSPITRPSFSDEIWDLSLYKEKLYLYWGPVPAILITPIQLLVDKKIADIFLVYFFSAGLLILNSLIIFKLRRIFFPNIAIWNAIVCIPLIGLILPILWSVNIPDVYEAAIGAGQFFLIGGVYFILSAFENDSSIDKWKLFWAGFFWACSVGSRAINTFSVIFFVAFVVFWIVWNLPRPINWIKIPQLIAPLFIPLMIGAVAIGWYNWARFDSPLEFGLRYQITIFNLNKQMGLVFQPDYFFPNLYGYVFQPFEFIARFPFIQPINGPAILNRLNITPPYLYAVGRVTGLLFCAPFLLLSLVHLFSDHKSNLPDRTKSHDFPIYLLLGSFLIGFLTILFYFFGQMRFLVDIISQITLLAVMGYWKLILRGQTSNSKAAKYFVGLSNLLIVLSICISFLLAFSSETNRMEKLNPRLIEKINNVLTLPE